MANTSPIAPRKATAVYMSFRRLAAPHWRERYPLSATILDGLPTLRKSSFKTIAGPMAAGFILSDWMEVSLAKLWEIFWKGGIWGPDPRRGIRMGKESHSGR